MKLLKLSLSVLLLIISNLIAKEAPQKIVPGMKISNMSNDSVWANLDGQKHEESYTRVSTSGKKTDTYNVVDFKKIEPKQSILLEETPKIESEDTGSYFQITFIQTNKNTTYVSLQSNIKALLDAYIKPLTPKYGNIWISSPDGYTSLYNPKGSQNVKTTPYKEEFAMKSKIKWVQINIPVFETFIVKVPKKKTRVTYLGWKQTRID